MSNPPLSICWNVQLHPKVFTSKIFTKGAAAPAAEELRPCQGSVTAPSRPRPLRGVSPGHSEEPLAAFRGDSPPLRGISVITQASFCLTAPGSHHSLFVTNTPGTARVSSQLMLLQGHCFPLNSPRGSLPGHPGNVRVKCSSPVDPEPSPSHPPGMASERGPGNAPRTASRSTCHSGQCPGG